MIIYFNVDERGYLTGWSSTSTKKQDEVQIEVDDDHEVLTNPFVFKYENGELIKDEEYQQELVDQEESKKNKMSESDMQALAILELATEIEKMKGGS